MITYSKFLDGIKNKEFSAKEFTSNIFNKIKEFSHLNAFITLCESEAIAAAEESDKRFADGNPRKLEGMIIAIKDNISTKNIRTTCGSKILENFVPVYDATVIERIKSEGGIIIGKTNLDEFAMGSSNETSFFGPVSHPLNQEYVPGGSSGGSAVAVAAGLAHVALGSDTGGSIRQPAAFCGNYGLKPTYGRISRYGLVAFASSLDQIGIFSNDIHDSSLLLDVISGVDEHDSTCAQMPSTNTLPNICNDFNNVRIGILPDSDLADCSPEVLKVYNQYLEQLKNLGFELKTIKFDNMQAWIPTYYILATAEASSNLARFDGVRYGFRANENETNDIITASRSQGFGEEVKRRIMLGTYVLSSGYYDAYYKKAQQARRMIQNNYNEIFSQVDFVLLPTTPTAAFKKNEKTKDPISMYLSDFFTTSANLAGIPAISIPAGNSESGFPIGMQLQANMFEEEKLLSFCKFLNNKS